MPESKDHMALTMYMTSTGYYQDSWRIPRDPNQEIGSFELFSSLAQMCEEAKLDAIFFADVLSAALSSTGGASDSVEPISMMGALAARTQKIGLIGTFSTTFTEPYNLARQLSGLDLISGGRIGWNIVTSVMGNENFGSNPLPPPDERYRRATEFVEVMTKLWGSWSDDAIINDRDRGMWLDPEKLHPIDHVGKYFQVVGPLNMQRSPQGHPVAVQAGISDDGINLGSSVADAVYTTQSEKQGAIDFRAKYKQRVIEKGRDPRSVKILPGILPIVGETEAEAQELAEMLANNLDYERGRESFARTFALDLEDVGLDDRIPAERFPEEHGLISFPSSRYRQFRSYALDEGFTVRALVAEKAKAGGHLSAVGSASRIADLMIDWFDSGACDGFNFNPPFIPDGMQRICELLVPALRERGYFRDEYEGSTLRDHLGIERPGAWDA